MSGRNDQVWGKWLNGDCVKKSFLSDFVMMGKKQNAFRPHRFRAETPKKAGILPSRGKVVSAALSVEGIFRQSSISHQPCHCHGHTCLDACLSKAVFFKTTILSPPITLSQCHLWRAPPDFNKMNIRLPREPFVSFVFHPPCEQRQAITVDYCREDGYNIAVLFQ